ncbi:hypothetical protein Y1Q_0022847 [Alligator mississippiensis]|uniref:Uncharacterized protein n=1 Tax=Alligator mississippiensis TaxID=8496 RepID=A0A151N5B0_ALLMI|nr:hypothetical protein Y1Q_0022847 [Alligator mississippiensis]
MGGRPGGAGALWVLSALGVLRGGARASGAASLAPLPLGIGREHRGVRADTVDCWEVRKQNSSQWCSFIRTNPDCQIDGGFLDYLDGVFCVFPSTLLPLAVTLYAMWLLYLFIILGVTAEKFFCPNLSAISTNLRLSHNVAVSFQ